LTTIILVCVCVHVMVLCAKGVGACAVGPSARESFIFVAVRVLPLPAPPALHRRTARIHPHPPRARGCTGARACAKKSHSFADEYSLGGGIPPARAVFASSP
jgi:hypothetical protein